MPEITEIICDNLQDALFEFQKRHKQSLDEGKTTMIVENIKAHEDGTASIYYSIKKNKAKE